MTRAFLRGASLLAATAFVLQMSVPASAQTTVLRGVVSKTGANSASVPLIRQEPKMDQSAKLSAGTTQTAGATRTVVVPQKTVVIYQRDNRTFFQKHPKVKSAVIGAGVGTAAGAATGLISGRGIWRGAAIGAGSGAGVGLIRSSNTMKRHPVIRDVATGTVVGLGLGAAASRRGRTMAKSAGIGAAAGLGWRLLRDYVR